MFQTHVTAVICSSPIWMTSLSKKALIFLTCFTAWMLSSPTLTDVVFNDDSFDFEPKIIIYTRYVYTEKVFGLAILVVWGQHRVNDCSYIGDVLQVWFNLLAYFSEVKDYSDFVFLLCSVSVTALYLFEPTCNGLFHDEVDCSIIPWSRYESVIEKTPQISHFTGLPLFDGVTAVRGISSLVEKLRKLFFQHYHIS